MSFIKLNWSANLLLRNYTKCLVGFDLRRKSTLSKVFLTSDDEIACYEEMWEKYDDIRYSLNLFSSLPHKIRGLIIPEDAAILAFDLPLSLAEEINNKNFSALTLSIELVSEKLNWKCLGYDVADAIRQYSAFYGFDWEQEEFDGILKSESIELNEYGIISDQQSAINAAIFFDKLIPEHAPFAPCGVWLEI
jgi:hypothetical protein